MTTDKQVLDLINKISKRKIEELETLMTEENQQLDEDPQTLLTSEIKKIIKMSLEHLVQLYGEFIEPDNCTLGAALQYIPILTVYGTSIAAQLGVTQEEYYTIVDYYLQKWDRYEKKEDKE